MIEIIITICGLSFPCKEVKVPVYADNAMVCVYNSQLIVSQWKEANLNSYYPGAYITKYKCKV